MRLHILQRHFASVHLRVVMHPTATSAYSMQTPLPQRVVLMTWGSLCSCDAGKGMHSRLYTRVLNQFPWMVNCTAVSSLYNDTGIFSIFASAESSSADEMVNVLCKELQVCACLSPATVHVTAAAVCSFNGMPACLLFPALLPVGIHV